MTPEMFLNWADRHVPHIVVDIVITVAACLASIVALEVTLAVLSAASRAIGVTP